MAQPKYADSKYVFLTDFDGTITLLDSNDHMVDTVGMGYKERRKINDKVVSEQQCFRDGFREMLESVKHPFSEMEELVRRDVKLDPGFKEFYAFAKQNNIPVIVVSSGMEPLIRSIFKNLIGDDADKIDIVSNGVAFTDPEQKGITWEVNYRHPENPYGHDKSLSILPYRNLEKPPLCSLQVMASQTCRLLVMLMCFLLRISRTTIWLLTAKTARLATTFSRIGQLSRRCWRRCVLLMYDIDKQLINGEITEKEIVTRQN